MKRVCILSLILALLLSLVACGSGGNDERVDDNKTTQSAEKDPDNTQKKDDDDDKPSVFGGDVTEEAVRNYKVADESDFKYEEADGGIRISEYLGNDTIVVIPETIEGKAVVEIAPFTFANDEEPDVKGVLIPAGVKELSSTFGNNKSVEVVICEGAEKILDNTFINCSKLHTVILGNALNELGNCAFGACGSLTELYIAPTLTGIDEEYSCMVFYGSTKLTIKGEAGSYIETLCEQEGIPFEAVNWTIVKRGEDTWERTKEAEENFGEIKLLQTFDKELLLKVVEKVVVHGPEEIEVIWKCDDIFKSYLV